ncbi:MAG: c-type cytochrome [Actinomycetota bacterium]
MTSLPARRRHPLAAALVVLVGLLLTGGAYAALAPAQAAAPTAAQTQALADGKRLFLANCASCHGLSGQGGSFGGGAYAPSLIGVGAAAVDFQVGTGRMPLAAPGVQARRGPVIFTDQEIAALSAYVASLGPGPAIPDQAALNYQGANLQEGGELFRTNCSQCHNFSGRGGALTDGKFAPSLQGVSPKHIYEAMITGPQSMPVFADTTLTPEQKQAIIKYLKTTQAEPNVGGLGLGRLGPVTEGLAGWIIGIGALIAVAVWIGAKTT